MKKFFFLMVALVVALTSCQANEYTFFFDNGMVTLRTTSDLSQEKLEGIQKEIEDVIANKAMTAKEIRKSVKRIIQDKIGTNNFSYCVRFWHKKNQNPNEC